MGLVQQGSWGFHSILQLDPSFWYIQKSPGARRGLAPVALSPGLDVTCQPPQQVHALAPQPPDRHALLRAGHRPPHDRVPHPALGPGVAAAAPLADEPRLAVHNIVAGARGPHVPAAGREVEARGRIGCPQSNGGRRAAREPLHFYREPREITQCVPFWQPGVEDAVADLLDQWLVLGAEGLPLAVRHHVWGW